MRYKNNECNTNGAGGGDEHHAGGDVFGVFGIEVVGVGEEVDDLFNRGIDSFRDEHDHNGKPNNYPFEIPNIEIDAGENNTGCSDRVETKIWLCGKRKDDSVPRMGKRNDMPAFFLKWMHDAATEGGQMVFQFIFIHGLFQLPR